MTKRWLWIAAIMIAAGGALYAQRQPGVTVVISVTDHQPDPKVPERSPTDLDPDAKEVDHRLVSSRDIAAVFARHRAWSVVESGPATYHVEVIRTILIPKKSRAQPERAIIDVHVQPPQGERMLLFASSGVGNGNIWQQAALRVFDEVNNDMNERRNSGKAATDAQRQLERVQDRIEKEQQKK